MYKNSIGHLIKSQGWILIKTWFLFRKWAEIALTAETNLAKPYGGLLKPMPHWHQHPKHVCEWFSSRQQQQPTAFDHFAGNQPSTHDWIDEVTVDCPVDERSRDTCSTTLRCWEEGTTQRRLDNNTDRVTQSLTICIETPATPLLVTVGCCVSACSPAAGVADSDCPTLAGVRNNNKNGP